MQGLRDIIEASTPREWLLFGGYALYLAFGYMTFESATVLESGGPIDASLVSLFLVSVLTVRIVVYAAVAVAGRIRRFGRTACAAAAGVTGLVGFVVMGMLVQFAGVIPARGMLPWLALCGAALGAGGVLVGMLWIRFAATFSLRSVYVFAMASNLTSLAVYLLATLAPSFLHVPLCAALFAVSAVCGHAALKLRPEERAVYEKESFSQAWRVLWRPVLSTSVLTFMGGFMLQVALWHAIPSDVFRSTALVTQCAVVVALLIPALVVKKAPALGAVYKTALPLSAAGFLLLPVIWNGVGGLANACAQLGTLVAGVILWCMVADAARARSVPVVPLFAVCMLCTSAAQLAGTLFGFLRAGSLQPGDVTLTAVALAAVYAVFMVSTFLFKDRSFKGASEAAERLGGHADGASAQGESGEAGVAAACSPEALRARREADFETRCDGIAEQAGFTPREREVFVLVARGKTNAAVAEELVVSENTVKFHIKSIYQKLGIHSKAEVAALVEDGGK